MTPKTATANDLGALRAQQRHHDALQIASLIRQSHPDDQAALAYQHAAHGCPLIDDAVACPLCDDPEAFCEAL